MRHLSPHCSPVATDSTHSSAKAEKHLLAIMAPKVASSPKQVVYARSKRFFYCGGLENGESHGFLLLCIQNFQFTARIWTILFKELECR